MEAFTLLKYWRGGGTALTLPSPSDTTTISNTTTILTSVTPNENTIESSDDDDEGPFFDLEFTAPEYDDASEETNQQQREEEYDDDDDEEEEESDGGDENENEFKITLSPSSNELRNDANLSLSSSEDLFKLVQMKPSSFVLNNPSEPNSKPQFTTSLLKSATKFRVFISGLKKPKSDSVSQKKQKPERIKFKVEEVPIVSLFTRDNSSKGNNNNNKSQSNQNQKQEALSPLEEKRFSKEVVMHKYLKMVKPLYVRVSRRYGEKVGKFVSTSNSNSNSNSGEKVEAEIAREGETVAETENVETNAKSQKQGNIPAGLRVVYKHLGKSRSASSAVAASPPAFVSSKRRDDSLLQQQDGIQGAILHCKRSFNASRECESSQLPRSVSDPLREISPELLTRISNDKRLSVQSGEK
ncbi:probable membrane-associated kinase regulator 2 isoform X2 [Cicer arietinum]|uniref:Probable membrane-associated kinase regulator 2 isoform X2 n=1 Tax=Cicer arietinum TaxID=3827 RepID=A0A1S2YXK7_CICAR|nr:probable membrane-associated kinase regulator 2 isoform X2 [Cicer arietinum]